MSGHQCGGANLRAVARSVGEHALDPVAFRTPHDYPEQETAVLSARQREVDRTVSEAEHPRSPDEAFIGFVPVAARVPRVTFAQVFVMKEEHVRRGDLDPRTDCDGLVRQDDTYPAQRRCRASADGIGAGPSEERRIYVGHGVAPHRGESHERARRERLASLMLAEEEPLVAGRAPRKARGPFRGQVQVEKISRVFRRPGGVDFIHVPYRPARHRQRISDQEAQPPLILAHADAIALEWKTRRPVDVEAKLRVTAPSERKRAIA
jgi:hypothetical protein